ncbi:hypothetical protein R3P38DRAFT_3243909 [Favolaschia claudopus]|uniref:RBR-type E3 ubiquitin transferase n=1 Tax=Favolaschia claudopus TaxID=2862362 RepID=A0AAV9Z2R9_9AGAR
MASTVRPQLCKHFSQSRCPFGDNCKFSHHDPGDSESLQPTRGGRGRRPGQQGRPTPVQPNGATSSTQRPSVSNATAGQVEERVQSASTLSGKRQGPKRGQKPCLAWRDGHCPKDDKCWFAHDPEVQEAERLRKEHAARVAEQHAELERKRIARLARQAAEQRAAERARQLELQAQKAETRRQEAVHTAQHIILGTSLVTYGAGIAVQEVVPGFETCRIQIQNLPSNVTHNDIKVLFTQQGVDERRVFIVGTKQLPGRRIEATLITNSEEGGAIAAGLEDIEFGDERLHFEVTENSKSGGMGSTSKDSDLLKISWRAPSTSVVATFGSVEEAAKKVKELDRQMCAGRRVHVVMNQPPPGYTRGGDWQRAVKITNLPSAVLMGTVTQFTGSYGLRFLKPISYDLPNGLRSLRQHMERICGGNLKSFDVIEDNIEMDTVLKVSNVQEEERLRKEHAIRIAQMYAADLERKRIAQLAIQAEQEAAERKRRIVLEARKAEIRRREATHTAQHIVLGTSLVTFGAGIAVQEVVPGFETCRIHIKNLPTNATRDEIKALFTQQGVDERRVFIVGTKKGYDGRLEATLIANGEEGGAIAAGLQDIEFGEERLHFEVLENTKFGGMGSRIKDTDLLTMCWFAPSNSVVANFSGIDEAEEKAKQLNRQVCAGRRVHVVMNQPPPGYTRGPGWERAVKITNVPLTATPEMVAQFAGSYQIKFLKSSPYDVGDGLRSLIQHIKQICGEKLKSFDVTEDRTEGLFTAKARFDSWETARGVQDALVGRQAYLGGCSLRFRLPNPLQYIISIPQQQYQSQKRIWDSFAELDGARSKTAYVRIFPSQTSSIQIKVLGEDKTAVGTLKVRVENLVAGKPLSGCWHRSFMAPAAAPFLDSVFDRTGAYARVDKIRRMVKVFGEVAAMDRARNMIRAEVDRLDSMEWSVFLKKQSIRFFVRRGIATLKEALGEENATLEISPYASKLVVRGGEGARRIVTRLIDESLEEAENGLQRATTGMVCPICYDEIAHPVTLGCDHTYCMGCLRHYLSAASDTFPLTCLGKDGTCQRPIPIPTIERFLTMSQFQQLLETAFLRHVERHPERYKYCKTADCTQIYRCTATATAMTCPSCFLTVCSRCDQECHEGMSCEDKRLQGDPEEQERRNNDWAQSNGVKRCPNCSVWIEKIDGCNHMSCRCDAHICWVCMGVFDAGQIYDHLSSAHGGSFDIPAEQR